MSDEMKSSFRILIVEDDAVNLELLEMVLQSNGFEVLGARDARKAVEIARKEQPDAILMDVQLPELDGLEATRILKKDPRTATIPVIAVTAHVKQDDETRCREAGCVLHIPKPLDTRSLPTVVTSVIRNANATRAR